jgi:CRP-like cAMP-binding protein
MSLDSDIARLSRVPLFQELNTVQVRLLAFSSVHRELTAGEALFHEGAEAFSGFVVANGEIVLLRGEGEAKQKVATCEPGSLIGELALFAEMRRPATAIATRPTDVIEINRALMARMLNEFPELAIRLRAFLAGRLTATVSELGRVAQALNRIGA